MLSKKNSPYPKSYFPSLIISSKIMSQSKLVNYTYCVTVSEERETVMSEKGKGKERVLSREKEGVTVGERPAGNGEKERASSPKGLGNSDPSFKRGNGSPSRSFNSKIGARAAELGQSWAHAVQGIRQFR